MPAHTITPPASWGTLFTPLTSANHYHSAIRFVTNAPYTTHHCDLYTLVGWPSLHIRRQTHWLQVIYKLLLGKDPPYLGSLVTTHPQHALQQVYFTGHPQSQFILWLSFFPVLCCTPVPLLAHTSSAHLSPQCLICHTGIISPLWPIYCVTPLILPHFHTLHLDFLYCIIDCMFVFFHV